MSVLCILMVPSILYLFYSILIQLLYSYFTLRSRLPTQPAIHTPLKQQTCVGPTNKAARKRDQGQKGFLCHGLASVIFYFYFPIFSLACWVDINTASNKKKNAELRAVPNFWPGRSRGGRFVGISRTSCGLRCGLLVGCGSLATQHKQSSQFARVARRRTIQDRSSSIGLSCRMPAILHTAALEFQWHPMMQPLLVATHNRWSTSTDKRQFRETH